MAGPVAAAAGGAAAAAPPLVQDWAESLEEGRDPEDVETGGGGGGLDAAGGADEAEVPAGLDTLLLFAPCPFLGCFGWGCGEDGGGCAGGGCLEAEAPSCPSFSPPIPLSFFFLLEFKSLCMKPFFSFFCLPGLPAVAGLAAWAGGAASVVHVELAELLSSA